MLKAVILTGGKLLGALALTLLVGDLIATRTCNCPTVYNKLLGRVPKPGVRFHWKIEGDGDGVWTSNGVRRASWPEGGPEGCLLAMGDSYTEGLFVTDEEHYAHRLEKRLHDNNIPVPVLAVAKSGFSVADYVSNAALYRKLFSPSWVIIQVGDDDFCDDAWNTGKPAGYAHFRRTDAAGKLEVVDLPPKDGGICGVASDRFPILLPILLFMQDRENVVMAWVKDRKQPWFHAEKAVDSAQAHGIMVTNYPVDQEMEMLAQAYDKRVILLYLPRFNPLDPDRETENELLLRKAAQTQGIHFVSLRDKFPELAGTAGQVPFGFANTRFNAGHWNRYGHQAAADLLFDEYQRIIHAVH